MQPYRPCFLQRSQQSSKALADVLRWKDCPADRLRPLVALVVETAGGLATAFADGRAGSDATLERAATGAERAADVAAAASVDPELAAIASAAVA